MLTSQLVGPPNVQLFDGDCLVVLPTLAASSVDLVVTSPPYNCGKKYGTVSDKMPWADYWAQVDAWLNQCLRVLTTGGRLAVNLPWWMGAKPKRDVVFEFTTRAIAVGFLNLDKILWVKGSEANVNTSGCGWGTYLSPSGPSIRCASEPILIFAKDKRGRGAVSGEGRGKCIRGDVTPAEWAQWTKNVWHIQGARCKDHPAVFPVEIPLRLVKLYTFPGETVLDIFTGTGTTGVACVRTGRAFIGIEKDPDYYGMASRRIHAAQLDTTN